MVRDLGYMNQNLVNGCTCHNVPVAGAAMSQGVMINLSNSVCSGGSDILRSQIIWTQMSFQRNDILAINHDKSNLTTALLRSHRVLVSVSGRPQRIVDDF